MNLKCGVSPDGGRKFVPHGLPMMGHHKNWEIPNMQKCHLYYDMLRNGKHIYKQYQSNLKGNGIYLVLLNTAHSRTSLPQRTQLLSHILTQSTNIIQNYILQCVLWY